METIKNRAEMKQYLTAFNNLNLLEETQGGYKIMASNMTIRTIKNEDLLDVTEDSRGVFVSVKCDGDIIDFLFNFDSK